MLQSALTKSRVFGSANDTRRCSHCTLRLGSRGAQSIRELKVWERTRRQRAAVAVQVVAKQAAAPKLQVEAEKVSDIKTRVTVTVPAATCKAAWNAVINELRKNHHLPGFRSTKTVPENLIIKQCGGEDRVKAAAVEHILTTTYAQALAQHGTTDMLQESEKIESAIAELVQQYSQTQPLTYTISIEHKPQVTWLRPYKGLQVQVKGWDDGATDADQVDRAVRKLLKFKGTLQVVQGRGVQAGDVMVVDIETTRADLNETIPGMSRQRVQVDTDEAETNFLPGVMQHLYGMNVGEERTINFTFPDTWEPETLRGVQARVRVAARELFVYELPELTDELAQQLLPQAKGVQGLIDAIRSGVENERAQKNNVQVVNAIAEALRPCFDVEVPESLLKAFGLQEYQVQILEAVQKGLLTRAAMEQLLTEEVVDNYIEQKRDELMEKYRPVLASEDIWEREKLQLDESEVEAEMQRACADFEASNTEFDKDRLREQVEENMKGEKVLAFLQEHAQITYTF